MLAEMRMKEAACGVSLLGSIVGVDEVRFGASA